MCGKSGQSHNCVESRLSRDQRAMRREVPRPFALGTQRRRSLAAYMDFDLKSHNKVDLNKVDLNKVDQNKVDLPRAAEQESVCDDLPLRKIWASHLGSCC